MERIVVLVSRPREARDDRRKLRNLRQRSRCFACFLLAHVRRHRTKKRDEPSTRSIFVQSDRSWRGMRKEFGSCWESWMRFPSTKTSSRELRANERRCGVEGSLSFLVFEKRTKASKGYVSSHRMEDAHQKRGILLSRFETRRRKRCFRPKSTRPTTDRSDRQARRCIPQSHGHFV